MIGVALFLLIVLWQRTRKMSFAPANTQEETYTPGNLQIRDFLPQSTTGILIHHQYYSLSYHEDHEQAEWVAYRLDRRMLEGKRSSRPDMFMEDNTIPGGSAEDNDYRGSGYTRGHLVPAADMAFNDEAMRQTFYFSNVSPQLAKFNGGIWRELEENVRDWARKEGLLYLVSGPVLKWPQMAEIGRNSLTVPSAFYKIIYAPDEKGGKSIAFIIPNEMSESPIDDYAVSIDSIETITGIDFFPGMEIDEIEAAFDIKLWPISRQKFKRRIETWNRN